MNRDAGLVLLNANVLTMDRTRPRAEAVAVHGERIVAVGASADVRRRAPDGARIIDCQGLTLLPGFNDAHCHLPGLARRMTDLDCRPELAPSIAALQSLLRRQAASRPTGKWVRGFGYDDRRMVEGRHPTRWDLDAAVPDRPVWLEHRSGHAATLNSTALELAGVFVDTPDPPGGVIDRHPPTGEPTGTLFEMQTFLRERLGNTRSRDEFDDGAKLAGELLARYGITSIQDAGADNGIDRWNLFLRQQSAGALRCRVTMFAGSHRMDELADNGLSHGSGDHWLRLGHAKLVITQTTGALHPSKAELSRLVSEAHDRAFPVALHCIEEEVIGVAAEVLSHCRLSWLTDRIEHCSEATPALVDAVRGCGATVVTQPGFVYHNGRSYREEVETRLLPHLYPAGALLRAGVDTAFGSDAPVIDPNPWPALYSAVTRNAGDGRPMCGENRSAQTVSAADALRMYTIAGARAEGAATEKGSITPGKLADMVLVDRDPLAAGPEDLPDTRTVATIVGGAVAWGNI